MKEPKVVKIVEEAIKMNMKDFLKAKTEKALKRRMKERAKAH